jgi:hypothetical protein
MRCGQNFAEPLNSADIFFGLIIIQAGLNAEMDEAIDKIEAPECLVSGGVGPRARRHAATPLVAMRSISDIGTPLRRAERLMALIWPAEIIRQIVRSETSSSCAAWVML